MKSSFKAGLLLTSWHSHSHALKQSRRLPPKLEGKAHKQADIIDNIPIEELPKRKPTPIVADPGFQLSKSLRIDENDLYQISSTYEGGWIQDGVMFDVQVLPITDGNGTAVSASSDGIVVLGLDVLTPVLDETVCIEIYSKEGGFEGFDTLESSWQFLGSVSVIGRGKETPTHIPIGSFVPAYIGLNSTRAFYVTTQDENLRYTAYSDGTTKTGTVFVKSEAGDSNSGMTVEILTGIAKNYPFAQSWPDRMFNGAILYSLGNNVNLTAILDENQVETAKAVKRGLITCDADLTENSPTVSPVIVFNSEPSQIPSNAPSYNPSIAPSTLGFTLKKVATTLHGGLKQSGLMFDIRVPTVEEGGPAEGITVISFEVSTFMTDEICVEVYSKEGTHVGFETDVFQSEDGSSSTTWSILGAATAIGMGEKEPTHLPVDAIDPTYIGPGKTRAYYVTMTIPEMRYTEPVFEEKTGDVFASSSMGHLELLVGTAKSYPFLDTWPDRIFNGAVIYALGQIEDGKYGILTANDRNRTCPTMSVPSVSPSVFVAPPATESAVAVSVPTQSPVTSTSTETTTATTGPSLGGVDAETGTMSSTNPSLSLSGGDTGSETTVTATTTTSTTSSLGEESNGTETNVTTNSSTVANGTETVVSTGENDVVDLVDTVDESTPGGTPAATPTARLDDVCPAGVAVTNDFKTKDVVVDYTYTLITNSSIDFEKSIAGIENLIHTELMAEKCSDVSVSKNRDMEEAITYYRFNSNPSDEVVTNESCVGVTLADSEKCRIVKGGMTASVKDTVEESSVKNDLGSFVDFVLNDAENHEALGVNDVIVESDSESSSGEVSNAVEAITDSQNQGTNDREGGLGTTAIILIALVGVCTLLVLVSLFVLRRRKGTKRERVNEDLFHEFPEEFSELGPDYGSTNHNVGDKPRNSSLFPPKDDLSTYGNAVILNDQDEMSLISNDKSKFMLYSQMPSTPNTQTSKDSKGTVEFVRAGQSFMSRSHQPEDTVDL